MADTGAGSGWVVEPPSRDSARIRLDFADSSEFTPELRQALDDLVRAMDEGEGGGTEEVEGFRVKCPKATSCDPQSWIPCAARTITDCTIRPCPSKSKVMM